MPRWFTTHHVGVAPGNSNPDDGGRGTRRRPLAGRSDSWAETETSTEVGRVLAEDVAPAGPLPVVAPSPPARPAVEAEVDGPAVGRVGLSGVPALAERGPAGDECETTAVRGRPPVASTVVGPVVPGVGRRTPTQTAACSTEGPSVTDGHTGGREESRRTTRPRHRSECTGTLGLGLVSTQALLTTEVDPGSVSRSTLPLPQPG